MWNCGVLLLCVCVMIRVPTLQGRVFPEITVPENLTDNASVFDRPYLSRSVIVVHISGFDLADYIRKLLKKTCPENKRCASKCCPIGKGFDLSDDKCRPISHEFIPPEGGLNTLKEFHVLEGFIECEQKEIKRLVSEVKRDFKLQTNGSLYMESDRAAGPGMIFDINEYCIDWFVTNDNITKWDAYICHIPRPFKMHRALTIACILITSILVLLRIVAFAYLPELQTLHARILLAYLISYFLALVLWTSKMFLTNGNYISRETCSILSFIDYFVTMSAFFWRNVMCYDIWWTFSGKRAKSGRGSSSRARFCVYCAYAFGWPIALTVLLAALEFSDLPDEHALMPKVRHHGCHGLKGYSKLTYIYGPILTLFVINMVLFALTALKIAAIKRETKNVLKSKESGTHGQNNDVQRFTLYANLFASMLFLELNWIIESVAIIYPDAKDVDVLSDCCNVVILIYILVNYLCKKRTWIMIKKGCQHITSFSSRLTTVNSTNPTMTSQISQISQSQDIAIDQCNPAESQNETLSRDFIREKSSLAESQENNLTNKYSQENHNPAMSQASTQSPNFSREKSCSAEGQGDTQSLDFIRKKSSFAESPDTQSCEFIRKYSIASESQDGNQSLDFIRENSSPAESQKYTQSPDFSQEKSNPAESQQYTQLPSFIREKSSHAESQDNTQPPDFSPEKSSPAESQEYTQSLDFIREKSSPAESQEYTQSADFSREKSSLAESQDDTQSANFSREKSSPAVSQDETQSPDFSPEKSSPPESQEYTQLLDFIREKSRPAESQDDTQSPDFSREKSSLAESQDDTQSPDFSPEKSSPAESQEYSESYFSRQQTIPNEEPDNTQSPEITVETKRAMLIAKNTPYQPRSVERSRILLRSMTALNHLTAVEKRQSVRRSSLRDPSINTDGTTFQYFKGNV